MAGNEAAERRKAEVFGDGGSAADDALAQAGKSGNAGGVNGSRTTKGPGQSRSGRNISGLTVAISHLNRSRDWFRLGAARYSSAG